MGWCIAIGVGAGVLVLIFLMARAGGNFEKRFELWFDDGLAALDKRYDLHCRVIEKLIQKYRMCEGGGGSSATRHFHSAILAGLDWMRRVKTTRQVMPWPNNVYYFGLFQALREEVEQEQQAFNEAMAQANEEIKNEPQSGEQASMFPTRDHVMKVAARTQAILRSKNLPQ